MTAAERRRVLEEGLGPDSGPEPILLYEDAPAGEDEKKLDQVDLEAIRRKVGNKQPEVEPEQFILMGMSAKECLLTTVKKTLGEYQQKLRKCVVDTWALMEQSTEDEVSEYGDIQAALAHLISATEKTKKRLGTPERSRRF